MRHAGMHLPNGAGDYDAIGRLPGSAFLILATEGRYHYGRLRAARPDATWVWRAIPRMGRRPAELSWDPSRVADECLNLWDEQGHGGQEHFLPLNELSLNYERGDSLDDFRDLPARYECLADFLSALRTNLKAQLGTGSQIHFQPWAPGHHEWDYLHLWQWAAEAHEVVHFHAYGTAEEIRSEYQRYRAAFPGKALFLGEWNTSGRGVGEDRRVLAMLAELCAQDPLLLGCTYFVWHWYDGWSDQFNVDDNEDRLALFANPPILANSPETEPEPEPEPAPPEPEPVPIGGTMTIEEAHKARWQAIVKTAVYNHDWGLEGAWRQHPEWGSPLTKEEDVLDDGRPVRVFANVCVAWNPDGAEVLA